MKSKNPLKILVEKKLKYIELKVNCVFATIFQYEKSIMCKNQKNDT